MIKITNKSVEMILLKNEADFNEWKDLFGLSFPSIKGNEPESYPCLLVTCLFTTGYDAAFVYVDNAKELLKASLEP